MNNGEHLKWLEAKQQRLLFVPLPNLLPSNNMMRAEGYLHPTKCYDATRKKSEYNYFPINYDREYVLDFYQSRVIRELSRDNQLVLLEMIKSLYDLEDSQEIPTIDEYFDSLIDDSKLKLVKDLAKKIGMRVIKK